MKSLKGTKTATNLLASFAGESQATARYTYYADVAKKQGYVQMSNIFTEIANQEKEHAKTYYNALKAELNDEVLKISAEYPVALFDNTLDNLKAAIAAETDEAENIYISFSEIAKEEGFDEISIRFKMIASVEASHANRFKALADTIENNTVFKKTADVTWQCSNCGYIYVGKEPPALCPACIHPQSYFEVVPGNS